MSRVDDRNVVSGNISPEEEETRAEVTLRPTSFGEFIGQDKLKENLAG